MSEPKKQYYQAEVGYGGEYEQFSFWVKGISPDIKGDVKNQYKRLRASREEDWDEKKYKFINCTPMPE
ncbi:MAG TPA: hypothetical protein VHO50_13880 [Bacteroidales bacterium]|nr:hypothetical protein [Bacteroidales bacterium]